MPISAYKYPDIQPINMPRKNGIAAIKGAPTQENPHINVKICIIIPDKKEKDNSIVKLTLLWLCKNAFIRKIRYLLLIFASALISNAPINIPSSIIEPSITA
ncbi:MAG: hypothetical protein RSC01_07400 [Oscillospiraceae bacterium]